MYLSSQHCKVLCTCAAAGYRDFALAHESTFLVGLAFLTWLGGGKCATHGVQIKHVTQVTWAIVPASSGGAAGLVFQTGMGSCGKRPTAARRDSPQNYNLQ